MKDERLQKDLDEIQMVEDEKYKDLLGKIHQILEGSSDHKSPAPKSIPKALGMTPFEFMTAPMESFTRICEETNYRKVTSSLNYVANFTGKNIPEVKERVAEIRTALREWKTGQTQQPPEPEPSEEET